MGAKLREFRQLGFMPVDPLPGPAYLSMMIAAIVVIPVMMFIVLIPAVHVFGAFGMSTTMMTGHTGDRRDHDALGVLVHAKIFLVDLTRHFIHAARDVLFGFGVARKIEPVLGGVRRPGMAKTAIYAQGLFPYMHGLAQIGVADVFGQYFKISLGLLVIRGAGSRHSNKHEGDQGSRDKDLFVFLHIGRFDARM